MICRKCGAEVKEGLKFCTNCGEPADAPAMGAGSPPPMPPESGRRKRERLYSRLEIERNYLLVYIIGGGFVSVFSLFAPRFLAQFGSAFVSAYAIASSPLSFASLPVFAVTIILMMIGHRVKRTGGSNFVTMIGAIAALGLELLFVFSCFFFGNALMSLYTVSDEVTAIGMGVLRWTGIGALIFTVIAAALGFLFHWKRFWVYMLTHTAVFTIAFLLLLFGAAAIHKPMFVPLTAGMMQAGIVMIPAVGFNVKGGETADGGM